jgi:arylsulfatase A-like enzyme
MRPIFGILAILICGSWLRADAPRQPNIVFILADDLGWTDLGCYGSKYYETPNIDRLAAEGMRFTSGYTCGPNCQPTRAALLSGQYGPRTGVYTVGNINRFDWQSRPLRPVENVTALPLEKITIADTLKKAGYATGMFGKWHLGNRPQHLPDKRGFDEFIEASGQHFDFRTTPKTDYPKGQYLADFLTDRAIDFIERHKDEPFFLYLPHFGVHSPHQAKPELIAKFKDKPPAGGHRDPTYAAMIASVDESVGRIISKLDEQGRTEDTLIIFTADNGGVGGYKQVGLNNDCITDNAPLKGGKGMLYEGAIRTSYIFRWKGTVEPGATNDTPITSVDLYPTLVEIAGAAAPADYALDGMSYVQLLTGTKKSLDRDAIYWHFPGYLGAKAGQGRTKPAGVVRAGDWKLLEFFEDGKLELYNLKDDIGEQHNLADANPKKAKQLHDKLVAWRAEIGAKMPKKNLRNGEGSRPSPKQARQRQRARQKAAEDN